MRTSGATVIPNFLLILDAIAWTAEHANSSGGGRKVEILVVTGAESEVENWLSPIRVKPGCGGAACGNQYTSN